MVIRIALVQLATPDAMRGRVGAVNYLFVNASNQLGAFESGTLAAFVGAMPAALIGGVGTVLIALLWMKLFPMLRDLERLEGAQSAAGRSGYLVGGRIFVFLRLLGHTVRSNHRFFNCR